MLGISIYPEKATIKEIKDYIDLAEKYGFKRVFTCLLSVNKSKEEIKNEFSEFISYAKSKGMHTILDISPRVFSQLEISYSDLSFFKELGADGIRLDESYNGKIESDMSLNEFDLDIEVNASQDTAYIENILSYNPKEKKILSCHNFYPQKYSGLSLDFFIKSSMKFKKAGIRTCAFVSSSTAQSGPWPIMDGLCTLEMHRSLPIDTQVKHLYALKFIDDIIIGNMFASEKELKAISSLSKDIMSFKVIMNETSEIEKKILFDEKHFYRGDVSEYLVRSTQSRVKYREEDFPPHNTNKSIKRGMIVIGNNSFLQYKGEVQVILKEINDIGQRNVLGQVVEEELFLLDYLCPWQTFKFEKN